LTAELSILIVGGYGTFGGRIVALLEQEPRLTLMIAGRSLARARAFRESRGAVQAKLVAMAFDRDGDTDQALIEVRPDLLVDASGPFQSYGERPWRLIEACIARGIHYLDLADGVDFVAGVDRFDATARAVGVFALSGVSTFPVLTAAAVRHLSGDFARVHVIRGGIAPSPFAGVGDNVIRAIAGYAGRSVRLRRDGVETTGYPFAEQMRFTIAPPGYVPLRQRLFSLVQVPDLWALPRLWPEVRTVWMGAAPVPEVLHRALVLLAWLVRLDLLPDLTPLAPLMVFVSNHLRWGAHRGGMFVEIEGTDATGLARRRCWHMIAEGDDGPFIPSMVVAAVVQRVLADRAPPPGARVATRELELDDYAALFSQRNIVAGTRDDAEERGPLYPRLLGAAFESLPEEVRAIHQATRAEGRATVERGHGLLARLAAILVGFPATATDVPVIVRFDAAGDSEIWTRTFGGETFFSRQFAGQGRWRHLLCERFGPMTFAMALVVDGDRLVLLLRGWRLFGMPLPLWLCPHATAFEAVDAGRFRFHVEIGHKFTGPIIRYRGWLAPVTGASDGG
jgi:hypothetical protein